MTNEDKLKRIFDQKKILILGFGREGKSTYKFVRSLLPGLKIGIADVRDSVKDDFCKLFDYDSNVIFHTGDDYLKSLSSYDMVIKSPGISYKLIPGILKAPVITSQTELFIKLFRDRIIGITGSKGKSTTSSIIYSIMCHANKDAVFVGNIGIPPFDRIKYIKDNSFIIYELSSHQLEQVTVSPHISILLNIFEEHLDHYNSYDDYKAAKFNIALHQRSDDYFVFNLENDLIRSLVNKYKLKSQLISFGTEPSIYKHYRLSGNDVVCSDGYVFKNIDKRCNIIGKHNLYNITASIIACQIAEISNKIIMQGLSAFSGLPHRLEHIGKYRDINFYNDSIATIPEATIEAIKNIPDLATIIIGGYDRGVNYQKLADCLSNSSISNFIFLGNAGKRIYKLIIQTNPNLSKFLHLVESLDEAVKLCIELTPSGKSCILSPAAASYDMFDNFEERGEKFKDLVIKYSKNK